MSPRHQLSEADLEFIRRDTERDDRENPLDPNHPAALLLQRLFGPGLRRLMAERNTGDAA